METIIQRWILNAKVLKFPTFTISMNNHLPNQDMKILFNLKALPLMVFLLFFQDRMMDDIECLWSKLKRCLGPSDPKGLLEIFNKTLEFEPWSRMTAKKLVDLLSA